MLKPTALASAVALVGGTAFVICGILAYLAPDLLFGVVSNWFHAMSLEAVRTTEPMSFGTFVLGVITFSAYIWVLTYAGTNVYNKLAK